MLPPVLPPAASWYPGHMSKFTRLLPTLLTRTDIVIELRDARLPLTSINPAFENAMSKWQIERQSMGSGTSESKILCERIVVLGKKDLVGQWGLQPFKRAMQKCYPNQHIHFISNAQVRTIRELSNLLTSIASRHAEATPEVNLLVVGMPNVGKSTLLNSLRNHGVAGPTPKALRTGAHPGLTRALSTRLKLSLDPLIYAFDSPGVMVPFMGHGDRGSERGVKLALIAGIKEGMYDIEALVAYLLYRLWILNPQNPLYMQLLSPTASQPSDVYEFLDKLTVRLGMLRRGGEQDTSRAATWFIKWWREKGCLASASTGPAFRINIDDEVAAWNAPATSQTDQPIVENPTRVGWGFDFEWELPQRRRISEGDIQRRMEELILAHAEALKSEKEAASSTQQKKKERQEKIDRRMAKQKAAGR